MKKKKLGEVLRDRGMISPGDLQKVIGEQQGKLIHLGELMLERSLVSKEDLGAALEEVSRIPYMDCASIAPDPSALKLVPRSMAERLCVLPMRKERNRLIVAMAAPQNLSALDELRFTTGWEISPRLSFRSELQQAIDKHYAAESGQASSSYGTIRGTERKQFEEMEFFSSSSRQANQEAIQEIQADLRQKKTPAVRLVSEMIQVAMANRASDIHVEPRVSDTVVRMRVDGVLHDHQLIPRGLQNSLISRVKILSDMDISERRIPQDGRFMVSVGERQLDLRVSTLPTQYGEKVVIRLLEASAPLTSFSELGMSAEVSERLSELLSAPQGMILVTGPTGSGKSTTLYSSLHKLRQASVNIVTVEDPIEYVLPGINQVHVNTRAGLSFVSCLRSILRQDPNIIMVGEIRDRETAEIVMKAAQTGHLVLSTLHTNDSVSAIIRLLDLGIPGYLISSSVTGILAQRLVRLLCPCHTVEPATPEFQARLAQFGLSKVPKSMAVPMGCDKCSQSGYSGRIGIYELLCVDDSVRAIIRTSGNVAEIRNTARSNGMSLMQEDALEKVLSGLTTLEEIIRVVPSENISFLDCPKCDQRILPLFNYCPHCGTKNAASSKAARSGTRHWFPEEVSSQ
jgi:type IV pilus assembly protein PilB